MKVKPQQMNAIAMQQMMAADPSGWGGYYDQAAMSAAAFAASNHDLWDLVDPTMGPGGFPMSVADSMDGNDSDSEHGDPDSSMSPPMSMILPGYAASMAGMPTGIPVPTSMSGNFTLDNVDLSGPLSTSEKDVLNELVQELGINHASSSPAGGVSQTPNAVLSSSSGGRVVPPITNGQAVISSTTIPAAVLSQKADSVGSVTRPPEQLKTPKRSMEKKGRSSVSPTPTVKRERPPTPDLEEILAKPVKQHKPVDIDAVLERNRKNAIQARINRQKKKHQVDALEDRISELEDMNRSLEVRNAQHENEKHELYREIAYLKSVIANQSVLAGLLKNVNHTENVVLTSSITRKRSAESSVSEGVPSKRERTEPQSTTAGVCLHVDKDVVSLEFCEKCATMAKNGDPV